MMNKFRKTLPFISAILLIVFCYFGIELSHILLPNYKNTIEEVRNSKRLSLLYFDNTASPELYPMNLYDKKIVKKAKSKFPYKYTNELIAGLMNSFCPKVHFSKDIDFDDYLECLDSSQTDIYYIKDVKFTATNKRKYTLNVAFKEENILYFSCIPEYSEKLSSKQIEKAYENLENDFKMYMGQEYEYFQQQERGDYYEFDPVMSEIDGTGFNNFAYFLVCFQEYYPTVVGIINDSTTPSISYNEMMYLTFTDKNYQFVMIYDPNDLEFVGFSLSEIN